MSDDHRQQDTQLQAKHNHILHTATVHNIAMIVWCVLNVCTVVASSSAVSDPAGARRLGNASMGMSIAGIVVSVVIVIIVVAVFTSSPSRSYCTYTYHGTCYRYRSYVGDYGYCSGTKDYYTDYCYYN